MSDDMRRSKAAAFFQFALGVMLPAAALLVELFTGMCSEIIVDPIPTPWHVLLVVAVVVSNWRTQRAIRLGKPVAPWEVRLAGLSIGVSLVYVAVFLPTYPFMVFGIVAYGLGLLPYAPLTAALAAWADLRALGHHGLLPEAPPKARYWILAGVLALGLADLRTVVTQLALIGMERPLAAAERDLARGILRTVGSEDVMLRACWWNRRQPPGPFPALAGLAFGQVYPDDARHAFFRVTGADPATRPGVDPVRPFVDFNFGRSWDPEQGGREIGRPAPGLSMVHSQLVGSLDPDAALGYLEWTIRFRNDHKFRQREARAFLRLPPGAVVSRLTLWVNGEPREAAFAGRGRVRAAYESIVRRSQDPVLVTTAGRDRVMVQCFPVPAEGGEMQVRLGLTTPLAVGPPNKAGLELPWIEASNFALDGVLAPRVTLASTGALVAASDGESAGWLTTSKGPGDLRKALHELPGAADQPHLLGGTLRAHQGSRAGRIFVTRDPALAEAVAEDPRREDASVVHQVLAPTPLPRPTRLIVAVEASAPLAPYREAIAAFLATLPGDIPVALRVADDASSDRGYLVEDRPPPAPATGPALAAQLQGTPFIGGQDTHPLLSAALEDARSTPGAVVLWLHGPHPPEVSWTSSTLRHWRNAKNSPALWHLQLAPGVNYALRELESLPEMRSLARSGDPAADLAALTDELAGRKALVRATRRRMAPGDLAAGAPRKESGMHLVRLWVRDEIRRRLDEDAPTAPDEEGPAPVDPRVQLAHTYQLVTPVSGAVVLENQRQYDEAGLKPADAGQVPTVPEPSTGLLLLVAAGALGMRRRDEDA
jgi:hypothetical protein